MGARRPARVRAASVFLLALRVLGLLEMPGAGASPGVGGTAGSLGDGPRFKYATVYGWELPADARPGRRQAQASDSRVVDTPYGSHVTVSFRTTGHFARDYRNLTLELHAELLAPHHATRRRRR